MRASKPLRLGISFALCLALCLGAAHAVAAPGKIATIAGTGTSGHNGDGRPAAKAKLAGPTAAVPTIDGGILIADRGNFIVRKVDKKGVIRRVAGRTGKGGFSADGKSALHTKFRPIGVAILPDGSYLVADGTNHRVRKVGLDGKVRTIAGTGSPAFNGDGRSARTANLNNPVSVAPLPDGGLLIAELGGNRIRKVSRSGQITTVAGTGVAGYNGDEIPATTAQINGPAGVAALAGGGFLIAERNGNRVRRVDPRGIIHTVAGDVEGGYNGDNIPASTAFLFRPSSAQPTIDGGILIADSGNNRIRKVRSDGVIITVAGTGTPGDGAGGGNPAAAVLKEPTSAFPMPDGGYLIADTGNSRIRRVDGASPPGECKNARLYVYLGTPGRDNLPGGPLPDAVVGLGAADVIGGGKGGDCLTGGDGNDKQKGGRGGDRLIGGPGSDKLLGGQGDDRLVGGPGPDKLLCGDGRDVAIRDAADRIAPGCERVIGAGG